MCFALREEKVISYARLLPLLRLQWWWIVRGSFDGWRKNFNNICRMIHALIFNYEDSVCHLSSTEAIGKPVFVFLWHKRKNSALKQFLNCYHPRSGWNPTPSPSGDGDGLHPRLGRPQFLVNNAGVIKYCWGKKFVTDAGDLLTTHRDIDIE